jgi:hypothetical protein
MDTGCCWLWTGPVLVKYRVHGRAFRAVSNVPGGGVHNAARLMHQAWYGVTPNPGQVVRHTCNQALCVNPDHLRLGTPADNAHDMARDRRARPWGMVDPQAADDCCAEHVAVDPSTGRPQLVPMPTDRKSASDLR